MAHRDDFEKIALPHMDAVFRAAMALGGPDHAEDLTQLTFTKALERFETFRQDTNCKAWLVRIMRNTWFDELRHRKVTGPELTIAEELVAGPAETEEETWTDASDLLENFSDPQVITALAQITDDQRLALFLVDVEDASLEEVAEITGVATGTVKSRCSRARAALKEKLQALAEDLGYTGRRR